MKTKFVAFLVVFIGCILSSTAQIKISTLNSDGTPNSNCYLNTDSKKIGMTNKFGLIFIDEKFKGESIKLIL